MAGSSFADAAIGAGSKIGRYFGIVSAVPSALFVLYVFALLSSGAWGAAPNLDTASEAVQDISLGQASFLLVVTLALGLLLHPLQFALVQVLEGYWGTNGVARALAARRILQNRRRFEDLRERHLAICKRLDAAGPGRLNARLGEDLVQDLVDAEALLSAIETFPPEQRRFMPTRLGNLLRRHEDLAGSQYRLEAPTIHPHLVLHGRPSHIGFLADARELLDLSVRLCILAVLAVVATFAVLITDGLWLLVALVPYGGAYVAYRGAVVAADQYGRAVATVIDLDRFDLYQQLHLPLPKSLEDERTRNRHLMDLLRGEEVEHEIEYEHHAQSSLDVTTAQRPA